MPDRHGREENPAGPVSMSFPGMSQDLGGVAVDEGAAAGWLAEWAGGQDEDWHPGWGNRGTEIAELVKDAVRQAVLRMPQGVALELDVMDGEGLDVSAWRVLVTISAPAGQEPLRLAGPQRFAEDPTADGEEYTEYTADESEIAASAAQALRWIAADASAHWVPLIASCGSTVPPAAGTTSILDRPPRAAIPVLDRAPAADERSAGRPQAAVVSA